MFMVFNLSPFAIICDCRNFNNSFYFALGSIGKTNSLYLYNHISMSPPCAHLVKGTFLYETTQH